MFKDKGVTDDLTSFKFNLEARYDRLSEFAQLCLSIILNSARLHLQNSSTDYGMIAVLITRYTDSWANTEDESSTDGEIEHEEKEEGEL